METQQEGIWISAQNHEIEPLLDAMKQLFETNVVNEHPLLSSERQIGLIQQAKQDMLHAKAAMEMGVEPDLVEIDIQSAHDHLKEIFGEVHREDLIDALFSKFCLGK